MIKKINFPLKIYVSTVILECLKFQVKNHSKIENYEIHKSPKLPSLIYLRLGEEIGKTF